MRSNLIFKGIREEHNEIWDDISRLLTSFICDNLNLSYSPEEIDMQISRAHRAKSDTSEGSQRNTNRPIIAQFVNWRIAEEIRNKIIYLNSTKQLQNVYGNQMFSKEVTSRRNNALMRRREILDTDKTIQIKLEFPATLKSRRLGSRGEWSTLEVF